MPAQDFSLAGKTAVVTGGYGVLTTQNRSVLIDAEGNLSARSKRVIDRTPMCRFGQPDELGGAVQWLCSDAASFVTGVVIPVDGGFSAFSGV